MLCLCKCKLSKTEYLDPLAIEKGIRGNFVAGFAAIPSDTPPQRLVKREKVRNRFAKVRNLWMDGFALRSVDLESNTFEFVAVRPRIHLV